MTGVTTRLDAGRERTELEQLTAALNTTLNRSSAVVGEVTSAVAQLDATAAQLVGTSDGMSRTAEGAQELTSVVSASAHEVSNGIDMVASGAEQMGVSIREISQNAVTVAGIAAEAVLAAEVTNQTVSALGESSKEIGDVINVITAIAEQTNLLARATAISSCASRHPGRRGHGRRGDRAHHADHRPHQRLPGHHRRRRRGADGHHGRDGEHRRHRGERSGAMVTNLDEVRQASDETSRELQVILAEAKELSDTSSRL